MPPLKWPFAPRHTRRRDLLVVLALYATALLAERLNWEVFAAGGAIGGHAKRVARPSFLQQGSQHPGRLFMHREALRQQVGGRLVAGLVGEREDVARGSRHRFMALDMTDPAKVKGFLDLFGAWNPSLALVMAGAIAVAVVAFARARRRTASWTGAHMEIPTSTVIDRRLILGGALFGAGWGVAGLCPGPAIVAASAGSLAALGFVAAMLVGMTLHDRVLARA